jgi:hypothetical protein
MRPDVKTHTDQVEIKCNADGLAAFVFRQDKTVITDLDTGAVIAEQFNRSAFDAAAPDAVALLGSIPAQLIANLQAAQLAEQTATEQLAQRTAERDNLAGQLADLAEQLAGEKARP